MIDRIGRYQITRELGRAGVSVVYLVLNTRLDRDVAIKALPAELASEPARLERFEHEAKTLASLPRRLPVQSVHSPDVVPARIRPREHCGEEAGRNPIFEIEA